jgi:hypothetical protein
MRLPCIKVDKVQGELKKTGLKFESTAAYKLDKTVVTQRRNSFVEQVGKSNNSLEGTIGQEKHTRSQSFEKTVQSSSPGQQTVQSK